MKQRADDEKGKKIILSQLQKVERQMIVVKTWKYL